MTKKTNWRLLVGKIFLYLLMFLAAIAFAFPFYYMFVLSSWQNIFSNPPRFWFGTDVAHNFKALTTQIPFLVNFFNSFGIATLGTIGTVIVATVCGYGFSKFDFKGKNILMTFVLSTMMIPPFLNIIPFFQMMKTFKWLNTWLPLVIPAMGSAYGVFLMTQFLKNSVPESLIDAARIDGLNEIGILANIVFPLGKNGIAVLGTITFVNSWNNFMGALVMLPNYKKSTLPVALSTMMQRSDTSWGGLMLGTLLSVMPLLIVIIFFSKQIIGNLTAGSVKG